MLVYIVNLWKNGLFGLKVVYFCIVWLKYRLDFYILIIEYKFFIKYMLEGRKLY